MTPVIRKAAWSSATPANGWSDDLRWYAAAIHQMKLRTPGLGSIAPGPARQRSRGDPEPDAAQTQDSGRSSPPSRR